VKELCVKELSVTELCVKEVTFRVVCDKDVCERVVCDKAACERVELPVTKLYEKKKSYLKIARRIERTRTKKNTRKKETEKICLKKYDTITNNGEINKLSK